MIRSAEKLPATAAGLLTSGPALAHGTLAESADFYAGALHPFLAWEHLLLLIGLGLALGRPPGPAGLLPVLGLMSGVAAGLLVNLGPLAGAAPVAILTAALVAGAVLAAGFAMPPLVRAAFAGVTGLLVGVDTDVTFAAPGDPLAWAAPLLGVGAGVLPIVINMMALSSLARVAPWTIGVRIGGSWIAASAILVLALTLTRLPVPA